MIYIYHTSHVCLRIYKHITYMLYTYMLYIHARVYVRMLTTPLHPQELRKSSSSSPQLWLVMTCLDRASGFLLTFGPRDLEPPLPPAGAPGSVRVRSLRRLWRVGPEGLAAFGGTRGLMRGCSHSPEERWPVWERSCELEHRGPQKWCHPDWLSSSDLSCQRLTAFASDPGKDLGGGCGVHVASREGASQAGGPRMVPTRSLGSEADNGRVLIPHEELNPTGQTCLSHDLSLHFKTDHNRNLHITVISNRQDANSRLSSSVRKTHPLGIREFREDSHKPTHRSPPRKKESKL